MSALAAPAAGRHRAADRSAGPAPAAAPAPAAGTRTPGRRRRAAVRALTNVVLLVALVAFLGLALGPHVLGYRTSTMLTGSMEPGISPGDVVVTVPEPAAELAVGDVISYQIPIEDHRTETHRVTEVGRDAVGRTTFRTRGDANDSVDPWTAVVEGDTVYQVRAVVPEVGHVLQILRTPVVQHGVLWAALGTGLLLGLLRIWSGSAPATGGRRG